MSNIRILPDILSNKIAAGEVVERPASVVKELVENALDAGATRLLIDIEQGGRSLIRVGDNGCGMSRDDALLSIERHATSKIATDQDLFNIQTLGFRGEALPSIAAVSKLSLVTRDAGSEAGTELTIEGGRLVNVAQTGAPEGTLVTVRQLFFNTPARRKFLKSVATEMAHIADILARMALAWPQVQLRLTHNERVVKSWPAASDPFERAAEVLGAVPRGDLHALGASRAGLAVSGWISHPRTCRKSASEVFIFVNRRFVRDRVAQHALFQGYSQRLVKGQYPLAVLFIHVPCDQVDVNVHPAKNEVRFARPNDVHELVRSAVAQTLYDVDQPSWKPSGFKEIAKGEGLVAEGRIEFGVRSSEGGRRSWAEIGGEASDRGYRGGTPLPQTTGEPGLRGGALDPVGEASGLDDRGKMPLPQNSGESSIQDPATRIQYQASTRPPQAAGRTAQTDLWPQPGFAGMRVIGQLHATYIICEAEDGLILVDQHAAHERVLYEQLTRRGENLRVSFQGLLVPETVDLGFREAQALEDLMPHLRELGLEVEPFGGGTVVVKSVPGFLAGREMRPLLIEIATASSDLEGRSNPQEALDFCRQRTACHAAIRAGQTLTTEQMQALLRQLEACGNLSHCPHGRPTWIKWEAVAIERSFRRV
jgi:DNA mismatch repair protein MutL